jgi:uncharacterized protein
MTCLDTNILIELLNSGSAGHENTTKHIENLSDDLCITQTNVGEVLRLLTHKKIFSNPLKIKTAVDLLSHFIESNNVRILEDNTDWWLTLPDLEKDIQNLSGNQVFDAKIAACLKSNGIKRIFTRDSDFRKYSFLQPIKEL